MFSFKDWLILLQEMPLATYKVGPYQVPGVPKKDPSLSGDVIYGFNASDRKIIENKKTSKKLEQVLARSTHHNFNILLIEMPRQLHRDKVSFYNYVTNYMHENNIPTANRITFAKNSSTGFVLTPWMLLHTLGHGLLDNTTKSKISSVLWSLYEKQREYEGQPKVINISNNSDFMDFVLKHFKFRSARNTFNDDMEQKYKVSDSDEMVFELVAEFLWHGFIRFHKDIEGSIVMTQPGLVENAISEIVYHIKDALDKAVGRVISDVE